MRIAFFDIDGTLAERTYVPESAAAALARMRESGDIVFICTGRARGYAEANFGRYADGFVCNNGRLAFMGERTLFKRPLSAEQLRDLVARLDSVEAGYAFFGERGAYYGGPEAYRPIAEGVLQLGTLEHGPDPDKACVYNFDVYFSDVVHRERIALALGDTCLLNPHGPHPSADVTVRGCDKGDAVRGVAEALGVALADTYAFGDGINDISMLQAAGHGVAMGNATDELKAVAEYVTADIHDDGVAKGLAFFGLA